jgi:hypothetical protein
MEFKLGHRYSQIFTDIWFFVAFNILVIRFHPRPQNGNSYTLEITKRLINPVSVRLSAHLILRCDLFSSQFKAACFENFGNVHFECLAKYSGGTDQQFKILGFKMLLHGGAYLPLSNHAKGVFLFGIPVHAVAKTAFFFTDFACKRARTFDKFIRFVWLDTDLYLIEKQGIRLQLRALARFCW